MPKLYIAKTGTKGRGVFTHNALPEGMVVEEAPVIVMSATERQLLDQTLLHDYIFEWQPNGQQLCCMALGWVPIFNHSYSSNCEYFMDYEEEQMCIKTIRPIAPGEELTINYNGNWNDTTPLWFDAV
jgi:hypothetical protein